jgi:hypothetical protein
MVSQTFGDNSPVVQPGQSDDAGLKNLDAALQALKTDFETQPANTL